MGPQADPARPRRLVICCDGTWNRPDQLDRGTSAPTNVTKLAIGVARSSADGVRQLLYYHKGVGTRRFERLRGGALGFGLSRAVRECYRFLVENYRPGDELFLFGFSRGAFTARSTAGLIRNCGIMRSAHVDRIDEAYELYRARRPEAHPRGIESRIFRRMYAHDESTTEIRFVGVWDTVGALGIPIRGLPFVKRLNRRYEFHDTQLSSHVRFAYQALAIDEQRGPFEPSLWTQKPDASDQTLEQVWFAGVHCDVGGGYREPELSEFALLWMADRAQRCGLAFEAGHFQRPAGEIDEELRRVGAELAPDALGAIHNSAKGFYRLLPKHRRRLATSSCESVASSAVLRSRELPDYRPPELEGYLAAGGAVTAIPEGTTSA